MKELEIIEYLLNEIKEEQDREKRYKEALEEANWKTDENGGHFWNYLEWYEPLPNKTLIKRNAMKARELLLKLYK